LDASPGVIIAAVGGLTERAGAVSVGGATACDVGVVVAPGGRSRSLVTMATRMGQMRADRRARKILHCQYPSLLGEFLPMARPGLRWNDFGRPV
jgi:hypothetical protein